MFTDREKLAVVAARRLAPAYQDEDLIAECRLGALSYEGTDALGIWLAAHREGINYLRRWLGRKGEKQALSLWRNEAKVETEWEGTEARLIWAWLAPRLTSQERYVLERWIWQGMNQREIAAEMGRHINSVQQLVQGGLNRYRKVAGVPESSGSRARRAGVARGSRARRQG